MKYILWKIHRLFKKLLMFLRGIWICLLYLTPNFVRTNGSVYLDCRRLHFGKNVSLGANVHIFGDGEVIIGNNVMIGDGTVICSSNKIVIESNTMIAAQCYLVDCNHGMHLTVPTQDPRPKTQDPRPKTQDPRPKTQDPRPKTQDPCNTNLLVREQYL